MVFLRLFLGACTESSLISAYLLSSGCLEIFCTNLEQIIDQDFELAHRYFEYITKQALVLQQKLGDVLDKDEGS